MAQDLITLEEYKEYRNLTNPDKDGKRLLLIKLCSKLIKNYCNRSFIDYVSTDKVEYFDARTDKVVLNETPLISVTHVKTSDDGGVTQTTLTADSADKDGYFVDLQNDTIYSQVEGYDFLTYVDHPHKSLEVSYKAGFVDDEGNPECPIDLKLAMFDLVQYYEDNEKQLQKSIASASVDNPAPVVSSDFPAHIKRILDLYRYLEV